MRHNNEKSTSRPTITLLSNIDQYIADKLLHK